MMSRIALFAASVALAAAQTPAASVDNEICPPAPPVMAGQAPAPLPSPHFVDPKNFDFAQLVPAPPTRDSLAGRADLEVVLHVQAWRTPEEVAWAKVADTDCVFNLASVLGAWLTRANLPRTEAFFKDLSDDIRVMDRAAKAPFLRPRPHVVDPTVQPCVRIPSTTSYPSGSALQAFAWAELFAEIFPEQRAALEVRAQRASWGRVLGGVHYPSDLTAGRQLVAPFLAECRKSAAFREAWEACRQEIRTKAGGGRGKP